MLNNNLAPIALFVYNRPLHTQQSLQSLAKNKQAKETLLYVFCDGFKPNATKEEQERIIETRALFKNLMGFKNVIVVKKEKNEGLANSIITGVTEVVNKHGSVIVLEDDLVVSPFFLEYMNDGLSVYKESANVYAINGYMFPINSERATTFLSPLATSSWGWATWVDKWRVFDTDIKYKKLIQSHPNIRQRFNFSDYDYAGMLDVKTSWAIKWYYSVFMRNGLGLFPTQSLVNNIGFDGSGTHGKNMFQQLNVYQEKILVSKQDIIDMENYKKMLDFFRGKKTSIFDLMHRLLKKDA